MKFSVLLPTRNGGRYLGDCIRSVLSQPYEDMELIVSDNANTDDTQKIIESFSEDPRLKTIRTEKPVSVTENWNNALAASSGDYILMIGDDDFLLPNYFIRMQEVIEKYKQPDGITYNGYGYIFPNAISENTPSYYSNPFFNYGPDFKQEKELSPDFLHQIVLDMFQFNVRVPLNTLPHLWSRKVINRVEGNIFRPPYPDHFALNSLFLKAKTWIFLPEQLFIIGVTPSSYGHFVFSDTKQKEGADYLGISMEFKDQLPGNALVNNMCVWLDLLRKNHPEHLTNIDISRANYVRHQVYHWVSQFRHGSITLTALRRLFSNLSYIDWMGVISSAWDKKSIQALLSRIIKPMIKTPKASKLNTFYYGPKVLEEVSNIKDFANWICRKKPENQR